MTVTQSDSASLNSVIKFKVKEVVLHHHPDLDSIAAFWLAKKHPEVFCNINDDNLRITFSSQEGPLPYNLSADELEKRGIICFDVGSGRFDHHPHGKCLDKCALDLVADFLGLYEDKALKLILDFVRLIDLEGRNVARNLREAGCKPEHAKKVDLLEDFSLAAIISVQRRILNDQPKLLIDWLCKFLDSFYQEQVRFWALEDEFLAKAKITEIFDGRRSLKVATIESEERKVGSFSRTREGGNCHVCIHRDPKSRHTFISGTLKSEEFIEIAKVLRVRELLARNIQTPFELAMLIESRFTINPIWYLPKDVNGNAFIVMNGGEKAENAEPSILSMNEMLEAVILAINVQFLAPACPKNSCLGKSCPLYQFGLRRCTIIQNPI